MTNHQSLYEVMAETSRRADESAGYPPREQASDEAADREQTDTPPYTVEQLCNALRWAGLVLLWAATIAVACGGAAWAGMWLLQWMEPYWPKLVALAAL